MNLYPQLSVRTRCQLNGSYWLIIMDGPAEEIELTFNGLFNLGATNAKKLDYLNPGQTIATVGSSEQGMLRFFYYRHNFDGQKSHVESTELAYEDLDKLLESKTKGNFYNPGCAESYEVRPFSEE